MAPAPGESNAGGHAGFSVAKSGDGRVALIGFPSVFILSDTQNILIHVYVYMYYAWYRLGSPHC